MICLYSSNIVICLFMCVEELTGSLVRKRISQISSIKNILFLLFHVENFDLNVCLMGPLSFVLHEPQATSPTIKIKSSFGDKRMDFWIEQKGKTFDHDFCY